MLNFQPIAEWVSLDVLNDAYHLTGLVMARATVFAVSTSNFADPFQSRHQNRHQNQVSRQQQCQNAATENSRVAMVNVSTVHGFVTEKKTARMGLMKLNVLYQVSFVQKAGKYLTPENYYIVDTITNK